MAALVVVLAGVAAPVHAAAAPASISGTVRSGGVPVSAGVMVAAVDRATSNAYTAYTDDVGRYSIGGLPGGDYALTMTGGGYIRQWFSGKSDQASADTISAPAGATLIGKDFAAVKGGVISGNVKGAGTPAIALSGVQVDVYDSTGRNLDYRWTDASGNFSFDGLPTGSYRLAYYETGEYLEEWWSGKGSFETADPIAVTAGASVTGTNTVLSKPGAISGTMTGVGGAALRGGVTLYGANGAWSDYVETDSAGVYTFPRVRPGSYTLQFYPYDSDYVVQWYSGKATAASADYFAVASGQSVTGRNAVMQKSLFADVEDPAATFFPYIQWMGTSGLSTGSVNPDGGKPLFLPVDPVTRQAFAAFLYRYSGEQFVAPATTTFADVPRTNPFFTAIEWMAAEGISTGSPNPAGGKPLFEPGANISRQATAAFLGRFAGISTAPPTTQVFADVPNTATFANAIDWMGANRISTGSPNPGGGLPLYKPTDNVTRQEVAAFLYRYDALPPR